ncbi:galanin receptor 2b-like [Ylistrum balloti]|uniref:galanin receptor 2b-like n=1 Tax=Ylistrum balloti TaxID=509963 RepID=UPI002905DEC4|nr:galanin receptor 2b-like [Ylistrum balloti]
MPSPNQFRKPEGTAYQDISGTFSIIVELVMVVVNFLPLVVIIKWKKYRERTTTDDIVIVLSVSYIVSVLVPTPLGHISYFQQKWYGGKSSCNFYQVTSTWFRLTSLFLVTLLCLDKSCAIYLYRAHNFTARYHGKLKIAVSVAVILLFTLFVSCLPVMGFGPDSSTDTRCESWISASPKKGREHLFSYLFLFCGFGNFLCVFITNFYMSWSLRKLKKNLYTGDRYRSTSSQSAVRWQIEGIVVLHGVKMVMAVSVLLYITWFPTMVLITLRKVGLKISDISVLYALLSTSLSGLLNPIIFGLFDKSYRHGYKKILKSIKFSCRCKKGEFQQIQAVSSDPSVPRSASDAVQLSANNYRDPLHHSASTGTSASGLNNAAFCDVTPHSLEDSERKAENSALLKYIGSDKGRKDNERTGLLENSSYFASSSAFGGPADPDNDSHSSSSSLLSSICDSQDDRSYSSSEEDDDDYVEYDESVVEESTM